MPRLRERTESLRPGERTESCWAEKGKRRERGGDMLPGEVAMPASHRGKGPDIEVGQGVLERTVIQDLGILEEMAIVRSRGRVNS